MTDRYSHDTMKRIVLIALAGLVAWTVLLVFLTAAGFISSHPGGEDWTPVLFIFLWIPGFLIAAVIIGVAALIRVIAKVLHLDHSSARTAEPGSAGNGERATASSVGRVDDDLGADGGSAP